MFTDLRTWSARRIVITAAVAIAALTGLVLASGLVGIEVGALALPGAWWAVPAAAAGSILIGLVVASYIGTPIGADATLCDTRWPVFGLIALYVATDARSAAPVLTGITRPVVAVAALVLLVWALRERLASERRATERLSHASSDGIDGEVCTTCRPLFPRSASMSRADRGEAHAAPTSQHTTPHPKKVAP